MGAAFDAERRVCLSFVGSSDTVITRGRDFIRWCLTRWNLLDQGPGGLAPELLDDLLLMTSELLANACVHGGGPRELVLERRPGVLRVEVSDRSLAAARRRATRPGYPGGYGLLVVDHLAACWGTKAATGGKTVWAELPTTRPRWC
ncbi:ATP-binding protein [Kitasatospora sp. NPDC101157]|uniref:ATP-binding protein n=1 Tax=Kitasatospora sp. NPDC101157 TaxID=3364098 RepID=UPI003828FFCC